jgi:hypothetical protein
MTVAAIAQTRWFASDALGNPLREIGELRKAEQEWLLSIQTQEGVETRRLFKLGVEVSRIERSAEGDSIRERRYSGGLLSGEQLFAKDGALIEETRYEGGEARLVMRYERRAGRVARVVTTDPGGALVSEDRYDYAPDGSLREHERLSADGLIERSRYDTRSGVLVERSYTRGEDLLVLTYTPSGRIEREETWSGQSLVALTRYSYRDRAHDTKPASSEEIDYRLNSRISREYDDEGRLVTEAHRSEGILVSVARYEYVGGFLSRSSLIGPRGEIESREYERDGEGGLIAERLYLSGSLARVARYKGGEIVAEEIWSEGRIVLKAHYEGGKRVSEEAFPLSETSGGGGR